MSDPIHQNMITRTPSDLCEGDVIHDPVGQRAVEIRDLYPIVINYCGQQTPVWYVRGEDTRPLKSTRTVRMLFVPRTPVQIILRRGGVSIAAG